MQPGLIYGQNTFWPKAILIQRVFIYLNVYRRVYLALQAGEN